MNCFSENSCENLWIRNKGGEVEYKCLLDERDVMGVSDCNKYVNSPPKEIVINVPKVKEIPKVEKIDWKIEKIDWDEGEKILLSKEPSFVIEGPKHRGWPKGKPRK